MCQDQEGFRVMVREINSPVQVDTCLARLKNLQRDNRTEYISSGAAMEARVEEEASIESRVIKKLVKLPKLKTVWLGTGDVHLE